MTDLGTDGLLAERGKTHGASYKDHAQITQALKSVIHHEISFSRLRAEHKETLEMIAHKIGRILAGDPNFNDHWDDIAGYARLASLACNVEKSEKP